MFMSSTLQFLVSRLKNHYNTPLYNPLYKPFNLRSFNYNSDDHWIGVLVATWRLLGFQCLDSGFRVAAWRFMGGWK